MSLLARTVRWIAPVVLLAALVPAPASACTVIQNSLRTSLWQRIVDWTPPLAAPAPTVRVYRGVAPRASESPRNLVSTSCDDLGLIELTFPPPLPGETLGYTFEVLAGHAPEGLLPAVALSAIARRDGTSGLSLTWIDGATLEQEPLSFVLGIRTVDRAGNRSHTVTRVLIQDPGRRWATGARPPKL